MSTDSHTPWPTPELFARLPWRRQLLEGLLGADVISFHTERYRKNFARTCGRLLGTEGVTVEGERVHLPDGRDVTTHANPISIDVDEFADLARSPQVRADVTQLREQFQGRKILLGVDRLDYTKGILERLRAFEALLDRNPRRGRPRPLPAARRTPSTPQRLPTGGHATNSPRRPHGTSPNPTGTGLVSALSRPARVRRARLRSAGGLAPGG